MRWCLKKLKSSAGPWPWSAPSLLHGAVLSSTSTGAILLFHWGNWLHCFEMIAIPVERQITHIDNKQRCYLKRQNNEAKNYTL